MSNASFFNKKDLMSRSPDLYSLNLLTMARRSWAWQRIFLSIIYEYDEQWMRGVVRVVFVKCCENDKIVPKNIFQYSNENIICNIILKSINIYVSLKI